MSMMKLMSSSNFDSDFDFKSQFQGLVKVDLLPRMLASRFGFGLKASGSSRSWPIRCGLSRRRAVVSGQYGFWLAIEFCIGSKAKVRLSKFAIKFCFRLKMKVRLSKLVVEIVVDRVGS